MINVENAIKLLKNMLPEKVSYANLIGASSCYGDKYVYEDPEPYAIELAISVLEKQLNNGWISVKEKLPENKTSVLITKSNGYVSIGFCNVNYNEWRENGYIIPTPLAWKPLDKPFKEGTNENTGNS